MNACFPRLGFVLTLAFATILPPLMADQAPDAQRAEERAISPKITAIRIENGFGPVTVIGADGDFGWHWTIEARGDKEEAQAVVKESQLEVKETTTELALKVVLPSNREGHSEHHFKIFGFSMDWTTGHNSGLTSRLELRVPRAAAVEVRNRFAKCRVTGLQSPVKIENQNGDVEVADIAAPIFARTSYARMTIERTGEADLRNQNGEVIAHAIAGALHASTSFARMEVHDVKGRAELSNRNGTVDAEAIDGDVLGNTSYANFKARHIGGKVAVKNQNGRVELTDVHGSVSADSSYADMRVEGVGGDAKLSCRNGRVDATQVGGSVTVSNSYASLHVVEVAGDATLDSENGSVSARQVAGFVRAKTSFAPMELDGAGKAFEAQNRNGSVHIVAHSPTVEKISASTSFGSLEVRLPSECKPAIRAATSYGKVTSDFPLVANESANAGGPRVALNGRNGDIRIRTLAKN